MPLFATVEYAAYCEPMHTEGITALSEALGAGNLTIQVERKVRPPVIRLELGNHVVGVVTGWADDTFSCKITDFRTARYLTHAPDVSADIEYRTLMDRDTRNPDVYAYRSDVTAIILRPDAEGRARVTLKRAPVSYIALYRAVERYVHVDEMPIPHRATETRAFPFPPSMGDVDVEMYVRTITDWIETHARNGKAVTAYRAPISDPRDPTEQQEGVELGVGPADRIPQHPDPVAEFMSMLFE